MTAYRYVRTGRLQATIMNGLWHVDPSDIRAFTERGSGLSRVRGDARLRAAARRVGADLWSGRSWESVVRAATDLEARIGLTRSTTFSPV